MTNREFFTAIINANLSDEMTAHAQTLLTALDTRNEKRRNTKTKEQIENEAHKANIVATIADRKEVTSATIASELGLTPQKVSALCRQLVEEGALTATEVKVKGKGKVKGYSVVE